MPPYPPPLDPDFLCATVCAWLDNFGVYSAKKSSIRAIMVYGYLANCAAIAIMRDSFPFNHNTAPHC